MVIVMDRKDIILNIKSYNDIDLLSDSNIKYINIDIKNVGSEVINYLKENGKNYLYSDLIDNKRGYIYVNYDTFMKAEELISDIRESVPSDLDKISLAKYLYIMIGKKVGLDISTLSNNDTFDLSKISIVNNIWGSLANGYATNVSYTKIYLYLCRLYNIDCDIVCVNDSSYLCNKLVIDNNSLIVDLTSDVKFIQCLFKTRSFANYNDDILLDRKIGYIKDNYSEVDIDNNIKNIYEGDFIYNFLKESLVYLPINDINAVELGLIYRQLFNRYYPNEDIKIDNLYINTINKKYFVLISHKDNYYSYNYNKNMFIKLNKSYLIDNFDNNNLGVYNNTNFINNLKDVV